MEAVFSVLIPAIVENVFGALTEAVGLSDWLRQRLGRDPEKLAFHQALTQALTDSATQYPGRDLRYFAEILRDIGGPLLARTLQPAAPLPTADELTTVWLNHLTVDSLIHYRAKFEQFATYFLDRLQFHLENQQPLRWIAEARHERDSQETLRRMANAAEQNAINLDVLHQELASLTNNLATVLQTTSGSTVTTSGGAYTGGNVRAQHFAGRDLTINQYFVEGLARLVFNYSGRIENFLYEYLGSKEKRVPFGGRQAQIDELNTWLDDPATPPYLLMVAEAGGGKSALVTRWSAQLTTHTDLEVIFVPISIRFQTAAQDVAFAALAARLAQIYERQSTLPAALSAEQWKGQCETYLRLPLPTGKQLLVVIDGLDEATGWEAGPELFAKRPPAGLRILVTARVRAKETDADRWAARLGWQDEQIARKLHLPGLDRRGIEEALVSMGNPLDHLATQVDLVGELHRLSQGDPLVVRLYVEALQAMGPTVARLRPEALANIEPGLDGFMERWWEDQRKQWRMQGKDPFAEEERLLPLLHACTVACGPLLLNDLAELDKQHFGKGLLVTHMAELLGRWVIGDGRKQGYVFSHPRLRNYFSDRMTPDEGREWQAKFCGWGERVLTALNAGMLDPKQAPEYLLRYYSTHLEHRNAPAEAFYALISNGWRLAWEWLDVSYAGFLDDVDRAWEQAKQVYAANKPGQAAALVQQIRAALCRSSVAALGSNIPTGLLAQLVATGLRTPLQALAIIKLVPYEQKQSDMLAALGEYLSTDLLWEALSVARSILRYNSRAAALTALISYLPEDARNNVLEECLSSTRTFWTGDLHVRTLSVLSPYLPEYKRINTLEEALHIARSLETAYSRATALGELIPHLQSSKKHEVLSEALNEARRIEFTSFRVAALGVLAQHLSETEQEKVLEEALNVAHTIAHFGSSRAEALAALVPHLNDGKRVKVVKEALNSIWVIDMGSSSVDTLVALAPYITTDLLDEALRIVNAIWNKSDRARALCALVPYLPENLRKQMVEHVSVMARTIEDIPSRIEVWGKLMPYLSTDILEEMLDTAHAIEREDFRADALSMLVPYLANNLQENALSYAREIEYEAFRADTIIALATYLPEGERWEVFNNEALNVTRAIQYEPSRVEALLSLVPHLCESERVKILEEALHDAHTIWNVSDRSHALSILVPYLPEHERTKTIQEALSAAHKIDYEPSRFYALITLAKSMNENERRKVLEESLSTVRAIDYGVSQAKALLELAPYLSNDLLWEALSIARDIKYKFERADVMGTLVCYMPAGLLPDLLNTAEEFNDESLRVSVLSALALALPSGEQSRILEEAVHIARTIRFSSLSATTLGKLVSQLSESKQGIVLEEALLNVSRSIWVESDRTDKLKTLTLYLPAWASRQPQESCLVFSKTLSILAIRPRPEFLKDLSILMPFILALAGDEAPQAAAGIYQAIQEVCEWWP